MNMITAKEQEHLESRPWGDLLHDILVSIHNKLHLVDQFRFRAVCKNWRIPKDFIRCSDSLPWVLTKLSWTKRTFKSDRYPFECELFDPYSQKTYNVSNYVQDHKDIYDPYDITKLYTSKYGWLLLGLLGHGSLLFLHNPFTNEVIMLPRLDFLCEAATFTMVPASPECEILVVCRPKCGINLIPLYVGRCCLSRDKEWSVEFLELSSHCTPRSVCYINGELYCLFAGGLLKRYNLTSKSWKLVVARLPERLTGYYGQSTAWLVENASDLILSSTGYENVTRVWLTFKVDLSNMCWVLAPSLNDVAFFISGGIIMSAPLEDSKLEIVRKYRAAVGSVACDDELLRLKIDNYFHMKGSQRQISLLGHTPTLMSFIEPPYLRN